MCFALAAGFPSQVATAYHSLSKVVVVVVVLVVGALHGRVVVLCAGPFEKIVVVEVGAADRPVPVLLAGDLRKTVFVVVQNEEDSVTQLD